MGNNQVLSNKGAVLAKVVNYEYGLECRKANIAKKRTSEFISQTCCIVDEILSDVEVALKSAIVKTSKFRYYAGGRKKKKK